MTTRPRPLVDGERFESAWHIRDLDDPLGVRQWVRWTSRPLSPGNTVRMVWTRFGPKLGPRDEVDQ